MNLAILIYSMSGGGAERVVSYLLPYMRKKGYSVHLILMNTSLSYPVPDDVPIHYLEKSNSSEHGIYKLLKLPFLAYKYAKLSKKLGLTHSFSLLTRPSYINILSRFFTGHRYKIIISERSHPSLQYGYKNLQSKVNNYLIKRLYPRADYIICNSKGNADDLISNYSINKDITKVIQNPIDLNAINQVQPIPDFYDKTYFNIITVGRLDAGKNQELLINAVEDFPSINLYILGDGPLKTHLHAIVENKKLNDRVSFLGFDNNPFRFLKAADLFMFGSNHEGFPNVLLEAMCCGLPILTTNCKSGPDEIMELKHPKTDDIMITDYGILTPVGNLQMLQKGLAYCLEHPEFLKNCRTRVIERIQDFKREPILEAYTRHILS